MSKPINPTYAECRNCRHTFPTVTMVVYHKGCYECLRCVSQNDDIHAYEFVEEIQAYRRKR